MAELRNVIYDIERCICHVPDACRDCSHYPDKNGGPIGCMEDLLSEALELLKKQEPMKPRSVSRHGAYPQIQHYCGACNAFLPRHKQEFCSVCGQAVKWGE